MHAFKISTERYPYLYIYRYKLQKIFELNRLKIEISVNKKIADFLDSPQQTATYTGLTQNPIKKRIKKHYSDIAKFSPDDPDEHQSGTRLSRHCGQLSLDGIAYTIEWSILCETGFAFNPITERCKLCLMEKYLIMFNPADATLNLRSEFFSQCRHKERHLLFHT